MNAKNGKPDSKPGSKENLQFQDSTSDLKKQGWVCLYRATLQNLSLWRRPLDLRLYLFLLMNAVHDPAGCDLAGTKIECGQYLRSLRSLQDDLTFIIEGGHFKRPGLAALKRSVDRLVRNGCVHVKDMPCGTLFTVVNYSEEQAFRPGKIVQVEHMPSGTQVERTKTSTMKAVREKENSSSGTQVERKWNTYKPCNKHVKQEGDPPLYPPQGGMNENPLKKNSSKENPTRIPEDWFPSEKLLTWTREEAGTALTEKDIMRAVDSFKDWWKGIPGAKGKKLDWDATFRNWIRMNIDRKERGAPPPKRADRIAPRETFQAGEVKL